MKIKISKIKEKLVEELYRFLFYFSFLALMFTSLTTYSRLLLDEYSISYIHYGYGIFQAMILAKIILLGESLRLGEKYANRPLIIPTVYKTIIFSIFVLLFSMLEHFVVGYFHGYSSEKIYLEFVDKGVDQSLATLLVLFFVFILFFAFLEIAHVVGEKKLVKLFFFRNNKED